MHSLHVALSAGHQSNQGNLHSEARLKRNQIYFSQNPLQLRCHHPLDHLTPKKEVQNQPEIVQHRAPGGDELPPFPRPLASPLLKRCINYFPHPLGPGRSCKSSWTRIKRVGRLPHTLEDSDHTNIGNTGF